MIHFWSRFGCLLGPSWAPFGCPFGPSEAQLRSKTRLECTSSSKTLFFTKYYVFQYFLTFFNLKMAPKMASARLKRPPRLTLNLFFSLLNFAFDFVSFWDRFWLPCPPKWLPLGTLFAIKIDQKIDPQSDCAKGRSQSAPRRPKTLPGHPPDPPGHPQMPSRTLLDRAPDPPGYPQKALPRFEIVENTSRKKVDNGHPRWSLASVAHKTESTFTTVGIQRVAAVVARSALQ